MPSGGTRLPIICLFFLAAAAVLGKEKAEPLQRLDEATAVLQEIMATSDRSIPQDLLDKSQCVVVVPGLKKGAFILGGKYGKGYISCRKQGAGWSAPGTVRVEGGSVGFQIGGSESDVVMLVMSGRGAEKLLSSKFTLGGEGEVAAGPVGRDATAQTDALMRAEILSWSRSRGVFAGVSLQGATLRQDLDDNAAIYGRKITNKEVVTSSMPVPNAAKPLVSALNKYSPGKN
jgi:lipid-binding SYLF domain-containing protein